MSDTYYSNYTVQPGQTLVIPGAGSYVSGPNQGHFSGTTTNEGTIEVEANDNPEGGEAAYTVDVGNDTLTGGQFHSSVFNGLRRYVAILSRRAAGACRGKR